MYSSGFWLECLLTAVLLSSEIIGVVRISPYIPRENPLFETNLFGLQAWHFPYPNCSAKAEILDQTNWTFLHLPLQHFATPYFICSRGNHGHLLVYYCLLLLLFLFIFHCQHFRWSVANLVSTGRTQESSPPSPGSSHGGIDQNMQQPPKLNFKFPYP